MIPRKVAAEVAEWPGAKILGVEIGRKHHRMRVAFGDKERFLILPSSSSDHRAEDNQVRDVRKVLTELGATRSARRKAAVKRQRNKPDRSLPSQPIAPVKADPWAALAGYIPPASPTPQRPLWKRIGLRLLLGALRRGG